MEPTAIQIVVSATPRRYAQPVTVEVLLVAGLLSWGGTTLLLDAWLTQRRPSLADRLRPFSGSVADEAEVWLRKH